MTPDPPRAAGQDDTVRANRSWWDAEAADYYAEHGDFLGDDDFVWGPEGLREADARLLRDLAGQRMLEIGAGAAQCSRYAARLGAQVVATDISAQMLRQGRLLEAVRRTGSAAAVSAAPTARVPMAQCDATVLPFADACFDIVFTAYGAVPFIADTAQLMRECARVLRPGGRLAFSTTHPMRWAFPDEPGPEGLVVASSYFDRTPYLESEDGILTYAEHHRTMGDRVRELTAAGLRLVDLVEPTWPASNQQVWGGWSPLRGALIPGTAIFIAEKPS